jgi:hypothetical protein
MIIGHQDWLDGLVKAAREAKQATHVDESV